MTILMGFTYVKCSYIVFVVEKLLVIFLMYIHNAVLYILGLHTPYGMGVSHATAITEIKL